jgi:DNA polymerase-3 subunit gamma/tau
MSLYQKYRAKKFSDVLNQKHVTEILQSAIKNNTFGHAYLFVGTRGIGKTSIARIFARTLNCQNEAFVKEHGEPCNECQSCIESLSGSNIDIIEMDAASNRGIDEVRSLIDTVDFLPSSGRFKIYVIDEVHMMTKEAFNALLKTLEEPPAHIIFMLCTTELFKVPATIVSRSQVFELKHAGIDQIVEKINKILKSEEFEIDEEGKRLIAKLGKGSFRDTESILEKVLVSTNDKKADLETVISILGLSSVLLVQKVKEFIYNRKLNELQRIISLDIDEGNLSTFNTQLVESIYEDIIEDLEKSTIDPFKTEIFDFLTSISKDLKNTTHPKLLYIAKMLNFLKNHIGQISDIRLQTSGRANNEQRTTNSEQEKAEMVKIPEGTDRSSLNSELSNSQTSKTEEFKNNPSAMLRASLRSKRVEKQENTNSLAESSDENQVKKPVKFISKIDFLDYVKERNLFLYRIFANNEFEIAGNKLTINVKSQMQKDLLSKPQNVEIFKKFGEEKGIHLKLEFGIPGSSEVVLEDQKVQKKAEDLTEDELKNIFNTKK